MEELKVVRDLRIARAEIVSDGGVLVDLYGGAPFDVMSVYWFPADFSSSRQRARFMDAISVWEKASTPVAYIRHPGGKRLVVLMSRLHLYTAPPENPNG